AWATSSYSACPGRRSIASSCAAISTTIAASSRSICGCWMCLCLRCTVPAPTRIRLPKTVDRRERVTKICLALPETSYEYRGSHAQYLAGKKTFAYFMDNHHGDGIVSVACKVLPGDNTALAASQPDRFYLPAYIGSRGWVALRLDVGEPDWE